MATTYVALDSQTTTSAVSSVTFSGISQAYTDLVVVVNAATSNNTPLYMKPNSNSSSVYSTTWLLGSGSTATSGRYNQAALGGAGILIDNYSGTTGFPSDFSGMAKYEIMNYSNTTTFKTILIRAGSGAGWTVASANLFASTAAISSLYLYPYAGTFAVGSTFTLYGIASAAVAAGGAKATGGDIVATDGTYWYHAFRASGTFTPTVALSCDVLVVAGGGGAQGGASYAGGGAGGLLGYTAQSLATSGYSVTVGAGGAGISSGVVAATSGSNSQFGALTASIGGGGAGGGWTGSGDGAAALSGGSGGGGGATYSVGGGTTTKVGGAGTSGQGFAGGNGSPVTGTASQLAGGGGGGASAVGSAGSSGGVGGAGGNGSNAYSAWASVTGTGASGYYAGGGAGWGQSGDAVGGLGNGGSSNGSAPVRPTANSGGGGNGASSTAGTAGASGIVIVRYAV